MEVMDLICRDRRSLEYSESRAGEDSLMRLARRPVLARHVAVVCSRSSPSEAVSLIMELNPSFNQCRRSNSNPKT
jgi:hypothetical protein